MPAPVADAARRRSDARAARDWPTADRLKAEIEAAGWRVIDAGLDYRLEPASPASTEVDGEIRYGRSDAVPSRLDEPPTGFASVVVLAASDANATGRAVAGLDAAAPAHVDVVVVADAVDPGPVGDHEVIRTSAPLGRGAAMNVGIRRARAGVVIVMDASVVPANDVVTPLVEALGAADVAVAGAVGVITRDLRRFEDVEPSTSALDVAVIRGGLIAFRRADAAARGPVDEAFRSGAYLDVWISLVLRDEDDGHPPRRAVAIPGLRLERSSFMAGQPERDRSARRNFYRVLDRFRTRLDLAVPTPVVRSVTDS